jgi:hypothetical protein
MTWSELKLRTIIGTEISVSRSRTKMIVTDYCRGCRKLWAENENEKFLVKVNKYGNLEIADRKKK